MCLLIPLKILLEKLSKLNFDYFQFMENIMMIKFLTKKNLIKKKKKKDYCNNSGQNKEDIQNYEKIKNSADIILWDSSGYEKATVGMRV